MKNHLAFRLTLGVVFIMENKIEEKIGNLIFNLLTEFWVFFCVCLKFSFYHWQTIERPSINILLSHFCCASSIRHLTLNDPAHAHFYDNFRNVFDF